jgi:hypothetical protein
MAQSNLSLNIPVKDSPDSFYKNPLPKVEYFIVLTQPQHSTNYFFEVFDFSGNLRGLFTLDSSETSIESRVSKLLSSIVGIANYQFILAVWKGSLAQKKFSDEVLSKISPKIAKFFKYYINISVCMSSCMEAIKNHTSDPSEFLDFFDTKKTHQTIKKPKTTTLQGHTEAGILVKIVSFFRKNGLPICGKFSPDKNPLGGGIFASEIITKSSFGKGGNIATGNF